MSIEKNKAFIKQYFETFNGKDKPAPLLKEFVTPSGETLIEHILAFESAFPRYHLTIEDMIAEGDKVVVRATFKGTHQGHLMNIPPTGKDVIQPLIVIYRISEGKIDKHWLVIDQLSIMQQLGAIPTKS